MRNSTPADGLIGVIGDVGGWSLTRLEAPFAVLVIAAGATHGIAFASLLLLFFIRKM